MRLILKWSAHREATRQVHAREPKLLSYGPVPLSETHRLYEAEVPPKTARIWRFAYREGSRHHAREPAGQRDHPGALNDNLQAELLKGAIERRRRRGARRSATQPQPGGRETVAEVPLVALAAVEKWASSVVGLDFILLPFANLFSS